MLWADGVLQWLNSDRARTPLREGEGRGAGEGGCSSQTELLSRTMDLKNSTRQTGSCNNTDEVLPLRAEVSVPTFSDRALVST